jgi:hypothetical protein
MMGQDYAGLSDRTNADLIIETHQVIHRLLPADVHVDVPFAPTLAELLPRDNIVVLRAFGILISLIRASALLHIRQRDCDEQGQIQATLDDYRLVHGVAGTFVAHSLSAANAPSTALQWVQLLTQRIAERAKQRANAGEPKEYAELQRLGDAGFVDHHCRWDQWLDINAIVDLSGRPRTTVQRHLQQLENASLIERQKVKRAYEYRLATPDGQLPNCPRLPSPDEVEREHMGTSRKHMSQQEMRYPNQDGQLIQGEPSDG